MNTVVTIVPTTDTLNTMLDKYPPTYEFKATPLDPTQGFLKEVLVGMCFDPSTDQTLSTRLRMAHNIVDAYSTPNRFGKIGIMPLASTAGLGLACTTLGSASTTGRLKSYAASLRLPEFLHASAALATGTAGGTTRDYSPFARILVGEDTTCYGIFLPLLTSGTVTVGTPLNLQ